MDIRTLSVMGLSAFFLVSCATIQSDQTEPVRVLYVTGGGFHDYQGQERIIIEALSARANIEWTVDFEAGTSNSHQLTRFEDPEWHEAFDVVVYNMCFAAVGDIDYIEGITSGHYESGTGAVVIHCSMHTFRDAETEQWNRLIGLRTYHHERQQREFELELVNGDHPVMAGFPEDGWVSPRDELYIVLETYENLVPLARAYGPESERHHTVMWVNEYGNARVAGTTAGHNNAVIADPVYMDFVSRGLLWTAGKLGDDGEPLPGYEGTGD